VTPTAAACVQLYAVPKDSPSVASSPKNPNAKLPKYLFRRGTLYYFKRKIPADLREHFGDGRDQLWKALGTALFEKAKIMLAVEVSEFDFAVAKHRREIAAKKAGLAPAVEPSSADSLAMSPANLPKGAVPAEQMELLRSIQESVQRLGAMVTGGAVTPAQSLDANAPTGRELSVAGGKKPRAKPPTQVSTDITYGARMPTLLHLYEDWKQNQTRPRTTKVVLNAVHEFRDIHGSLAVESITRQHARDYRDLLKERGLAKITIENRIGFLSTLVRHGMVEIIENLERNPFEKIAITGGAGIRPEKNRRAYALAELNVIFGSALYTGDYQAGGQSKEAAYWLPILGPFIGARIEEICQLDVDDIQRINGSWCLRICDLSIDQKIKNTGSFRRVPLHEYVIKSGFLRHVATMKLAGHTRLFPSLSNANENGVFSNAPGKWFGRYIGKLGLTDHRLDYHSYRYFFRQHCSLCGVEEEPRDALTGHWVGKSDGSRTYLKGENGQYPYPILVEAIQKLRYEDLKIAHLFVNDPYAGVVETLIG
jgi:integrase